MRIANVSRIVGISVTFDLCSKGFASTKEKKSLEKNYQKTASFNQLFKKRYLKYFFSCYLSDDMKTY